MTDTSIPTLELIGLWFKYGQDIFADEENYVKWLHTPIWQLDGLSAIEYLDQPDGSFERVEAILCRIAYGIPP